jgi:TPR repeat protein
MSRKLISMLILVTTCQFAHADLFDGLSETLSNTQGSDHFWYWVYFSGCAVTLLELALWFPLQLLLASMSHERIYKLNLKKLDRSKLYDGFYKESIEPKLVVVALSWITALFLPLCAILAIASLPFQWLFLKLRPEEIKLLEYPLRTNTSLPKEAVWAYTLARRIKGDGWLPPHSPKDLASALNSTADHLLSFNKQLALQYLLNLDVVDAEIVKALHENPYEHDEYKFPYEKYGGFKFRQVYGHAIDERTSLDNVIEYANKEIILAQRDLGLMYYFGKGVPEDLQQAIGWLTKAAEKNDAIAQYYLGKTYSEGKYWLEKDDKKALEWLTKAAEQGHSTARGLLAEMYVDIDEKSVPWDWAKAAELGLANAQYQMGHMYATGRDYSKSGRNVEMTQDYKQSIDWYTQAAKQDYERAQYALGLIYYDGIAAPQDFKKAFGWFTKAAEQGDAEAQVKLAEMYSKGKGMPIDYKLTYVWLSLATTHSWCKEEQAEELETAYNALGVLEYEEAQRMATELKQKIEKNIAAKKSPLQPQVSG